MAYKRIVRSALYFYPITHLHPSLDVRTLVVAAIQRCLDTHTVELAWLWDAAALLIKSHKQEAATEAAENSRGGQQVDEAKQRARHSAVCRSDLTQVDPLLCCLILPTLGYASLHPHFYPYARVVAFLETHDHDLSLSLCKP